MTIKDALKLTGFSESVFLRSVDDLGDFNLSCLLSREERSGDKALAAQSYETRVARLESEMLARPFHEFIARFLSLVTRGEPLASSHFYPHFAGHQLCGWTEKNGYVAHLFDLVRDVKAYAALPYSEMAARPELCEVMPAHAPRAGLAAGTYDRDGLALGATASR